MDIAANVLRVREIGLVRVYGPLPVVYGVHLDVGTGFLCRLFDSLAFAPAAAEHVNDN